MSLKQIKQDLIGTEAVPATLESTYTGNSSANVSSAMDVKNAKQIYIQVGYTMGAAETSNSIEIKVEVADDATGTPTVWYRLVNESTSGGTTTLTNGERTFVAVSAAATYDYINIDIPNGHKYIRVSAKETGVASAKGSAKIKLVTVSEESIN